MRTLTHAAAALGAVLAAGAPGAGPIEVIFTEVPGHPTAVVPGAVDLDGNPVLTEFKAIELLSVAPDGSQWIITARNYLGDELETMVLLGAGTAGAVLVQEGRPVVNGAPGELYDFFGSGRARFDAAGRYTFTARARGGDAATAHKGHYYDGAQLLLVRRQGDPISGLIDLPPNPSGDELFGNSFGSMHPLADGTIGYQDSTIQNLHSSRRPALMYDDVAFLQSGVSRVDEGVWDSFDANRFHTTPDGAHWMAQGDDEGATATDAILVVDGLVVLREGSPAAPAGPTVTAIFNAEMLRTGDWLARGDDPADDDWLVRNGELLAATGQGIGAGPEAWADVLVAGGGNCKGDWIVAGRTSSADPEADEVLVLNGAEVLVREGDPVDLDGDGLFDDDAFIGRGDAALSAFQPDDAFITDDMIVYFLAPLRDAEGNDLGGFGSGGDALLRIRSRLCPEDFDGDDEVGFSDLLQALSEWGPCDLCTQDLDCDDEVGFPDLLLVLSSWGRCDAP
jgi:hypothetical protein